MRLALLALVLIVMTSAAIAQVRTCTTHCYPGLGTCTTTCN